MEFLKGAWDMHGIFLKGPIRMEFLKGDWHIQTVHGIFEGGHMHGICFMNCDK